MRSNRTSRWKPHQRSRLRGWGRRWLKWQSWPRAGSGWCTRASSSECQWRRTSCWGRAGTSRSSTFWETGPYLARPTNRCCSLPSSQRCCSCHLQPFEMCLCSLTARHLPWQDCVFGVSRCPGGPASAGPCLAACPRSSTYHPKRLQLRCSSLVFFCGTY